MNELLVAIIGYPIVSSALVVGAGWAGPDLGMTSRDAMWATVQAVIIAPAVLLMIALFIVAFG